MAAHVQYRQSIKEREIVAVFPEHLRYVLFQSVDTPEFEIREVTAESGQEGIEL